MTRLPIKKIFAFVALCAVLSLTTCQQPTPEPAITPADVPTAAPTAVSPTRTTQPTATPLPPPTPELDHTLFPIPWTDRTVFTSGLIASEQAVLDSPQLDGATVYHIDMTISADYTTLTGRQAIHYTNRSETPLTELYLRLYPELSNGRTELTNIQQAGHPLQPSYELGRSAVRLPLETPLQPNKATTITLDFTVRVPTTEGGNYGTFIYDQEILALAHFYPFVPVYDPTSGWDVELPSPLGDVIHGESSFYIVEVTAPAELVLVGSGFALDATTANDEQTVRYAAGPMRDFYLIGSERFEQTTTIVGETTLNHYGFPETAAANQHALEIAAEAVTLFNEEIGRYPFSEFDLAASPTRALGVEYPGLIVNALRLYFDPNNISLTTTTVHEVGHQWFYSTVGNDQLAEPWLDESLTQFVTLLFFEETQPSVAAEAFRTQLEEWGSYAAQNDVPLGRPVAAYEDPSFAYGATIYGYGPLFFTTLRTEIGEEAFTAFLRSYYSTHKFGRATTESLQATAENACACELDGLFNKWVFGE